MTELLRERFASARRLPYKERRREIDKLLREMFSRSLLPDDIHWRSVCDASPLIGDSPKQVSVRPWRDSILLATPLPVREGLAARALGCKSAPTPFDVSIAILEPDTNGLRDPKTMTGYRFGWPRSWDHAATERWITETVMGPAVPTSADAAIESAIEKAIVTSPREGMIDTLIECHDHIVCGVLWRTGLVAEPKTVASISEWARLHIISSLESLDDAPTGRELGSAWTLIDARDAERDSKELEAHYLSDETSGMMTPPWVRLGNDGAVSIATRFKISIEESEPLPVPPTSTATAKHEAIMTATETPAFDTALALKVVEPMLPIVTAGAVSTIEDLRDKISLAATAKDYIKQLNDSITELKGQLDKAASAAIKVSLPIGEIKRSESAGFPTGRLVTAKANEVFGISGDMAKRFDFDVPMYEWDDTHPLVPEIDAAYVFDKKNLALALDALVVGDNAWMYGHTGSGKTTFFEQIAARLNWPLVRVNGDSDISRFELIGKTDFKDGATVFTPGVLVTALEQGAMLLMDEFDVTRSETAYILNRMLENRGLLLLEDGGRFIAPHPTFRMVAACNSRGNGDEYGIYPAVRAQSAATRSRFTVWIEHDYLKADQETKLLISKTNIAKELAQKWVRLANEVRDAFKRGQVLEVISPRELLAACTRYQRLNVRLKDDKEALKMAIEAAVLSRCSSSDRAAIAEMTQRVFGV